MNEWHRKSNSCHETVVATSKSCRWIQCSWTIGCAVVPRCSSDIFIPEVFSSPGVRDFTRTEDTRRTLSSLPNEKASIGGYTWEKACVAGNHAKEAVSLFDEALDRNHVRAEGFKPIIRSLCRNINATN